MSFEGKLSRSDEIVGPMVECPKCKSRDIHASRTRSNWELLRKELTGKRPFRCHGCGWRGWGVETCRPFSEQQRPLAAARVLARQPRDPQGVAFAITDPLDSPGTPRLARDKPRAPGANGSESARRARTERSNGTYRDSSPAAPAAGEARTRTRPVGARTYYAHETAVVGQPCQIGDGTSIWYFSNVMAGARVGRGCVLGQNVMIESGVVVGDHVTIQNNVSLYAGVVLEDDVFCGPSCVFTNVNNPRSEMARTHPFKPTIVKKGATIGANATIVCGATIGRFAFIGAGAVVRGDIPDYALMLGVPARQRGWMSRHGHRLQPDSSGKLICPESGWHYVESPDGYLRCRDWPEDRRTLQ